MSEDDRRYGFEAFDCAPALRLEAHERVSELQHAGLALATSLSAFLNAGLLFAGLYRLGIYRPLAGWGKMGLRMLLANGAMVAVILLLCAESRHWLNWSVWQRACQLGGLCLAGVAVYAVVLVASGLRLRHLRH